MQILNDHHSLLKNDHGYGNILPKFSVILITRRLNTTIAGYYVIAIQTSKRLHILGITSGTRYIRARQQAVINKQNYCMRRKLFLMAHRARI